MSNQPPPTKIVAGDSVLLLEAWSPDSMHIGIDEMPDREAGIILSPAQLRELGAACFAQADAADGSTTTIGVMLPGRVENVRLAVNVEPVKDGAELTCRRCGKRAVAVFDIGEGIESRAAAAESHARWPAEHICEPPK